MPFIYGFWLGYEQCHETQPKMQTRTFICMQMHANSLIIGEQSFVSRLLLLFFFLFSQTIEEIR